MRIKHDYTADVTTGTALDFCWQSLTPQGESKGYLSGDIAALVAVEAGVENKVVIGQGEPADMLALADERNAQNTAI